MGFALEIRAGEKNYMTDLPDVAASGLASLENRGYSQDVHQLIGEKDAQLGEERTVSRQLLTDAIERLLAPAQSLGSGFRVRAKFYPGDPGNAGRGVGGILIDGIYFGIFCSDDHWEMRPTQPTPGKSFPLEMRGQYRYEPAEIKSENMGIVKVERKKGKRKELVNLLTDVKKFLRGVPDEFVAVTIG
jgi:hypothetical protein